MPGSGGKPCATPNHLYEHAQEPRISAASLGDSFSKSFFERNTFASTLFGNRRASTTGQLFGPHASVAVVTHPSGSNAGGTAPAAPHGSSAVAMIHNLLHQVVPHSLPPAAVESRVSLISADAGTPRAGPASQGAGSQGSGGMTLDACVFQVSPALMEHICKL